MWINSLQRLSSVYFTQAKKKNAKVRANAFKPKA